MHRTTHFTSEARFDLSLQSERKKSSIHDRIGHLFLRILEQHFIAIDRSSSHDSLGNLCALKGSVKRRLFFTGRNDWRWKPGWNLPFVSTRRRGVLAPFDVSNQARHRNEKRRGRTRAICWKKEEKIIEDVGVSKWLSRPLLRVLLIRLSHFNTSVRSIRIDAPGDVLIRISQIHPNVVI